MGFRSHSNLEQLQSAFITGLPFAVKAQGVSNENASVALTNLGEGRQLLN